MDGLRTQFGGGIVAMVVVLLATAIGMVVVWRRAPAGDREAARRHAGWVTLAGSVALVVSATALPRAWPPVWDGWGDLALVPGDGGLAGWRDLATPLDSLPAVQLWANVGLYVPVGMALRVMTGSAARTLLAGAALSILLEAWQFVALSRVASTDDVLLNVAGLAIGLAVAARVPGPGRDVGAQPPERA